KAGAAPRYPGGAPEALGISQHDAGRLFLPGAALVRVDSGIGPDAERSESADQPADQRRRGADSLRVGVLLDVAVAGLFSDAAAGHILHSDGLLLDRKPDETVKDGDGAVRSKCGIGVRLLVLVWHVGEYSHRAGSLPGAVYTASLCLLARGMAQANRGN